MTNNNNLALEVRGLTKTYGDFTLDRASFSLPRGCILGLIGENGAGKSTLLRLLLGLARPDAGEAFLLGRPSREADGPLREQVGVVFDECRFPQGLTLGEIRQVLAGCYKTWDDGRFSVLCRRFSLPDNKKVKEMSRGTKTKLSIAAALSHDSRLLLLDEATSGLDPVVRDEILDVFCDFTRDEGHSILLSSHILSDLEKICDYVTFIHRGRVVFSEAKDDLLAEYVVARCTKEQYAALPPRLVLGARVGSFGAQALMRRRDLPPGVVADPASIEDIMVYHGKGEVR